MPKPPQQQRLGGLANHRGTCARCCCCCCLVCLPGWCGWCGAQGSSLDGKTVPRGHLRGPRLVGVEGCWVICCSDCLDELLDTVEGCVLRTTHLVFSPKPSDYVHVYQATLFSLNDPRRILQLVSEVFRVFLCLRAVHLKSYRPVKIIDTELVLCFDTLESLWWIKDVFLGGFFCNK